MLAAQATTWPGPQASARSRRRTADAAAEFAFTVCGEHRDPEQPVGLRDLVELCLGQSAPSVEHAEQPAVVAVAEQRRAAVRIAFNVPLLILTVGLAGLTYQSFGPVWTSLDSPRFLVPLFFCGLVYYLVNTASISTVIGLSDGKNPFRVWKQNYMWNFFHILAFFPVAAVIALLYRNAGVWIASTTLTTAGSSPCGTLPGLINQGRRTGSRSPSTASRAAGCAATACSLDPSRRSRTRRVHAGASLASFVRNDRFIDFCPNTIGASSGRLALPTVCLFRF